MTFTWDSWGRLMQVVTDTDMITYTYNGDSVRVGKSVNGVPTAYLQDLSQGMPFVIASTSAGNTQRFVYGLDLLATQDETNAWSFYHYDSLGNVRHMSNESGQGTIAYQYDAFGAVRNQVGNSDNPFTFAGGQVDESINLLFLRARYYDPEIGRFLSTDPMPDVPGVNQTLNPYLYALNNPINAKDPSGKSSLDRSGYSRSPSILGMTSKASYANPNAAYYQHSDVQHAAYIDPTPDWFTNFKNHYGKAKDILGHAEKHSGWGAGILEVLGESKLSNLLRGVQQRTESISGKLKYVDYAKEGLDTYYYTEQVDAKVEAGVYGSGEGAEQIGRSVKWLGLIERGMGKLSNFSCFGCETISENEMITKSADRSFVREAVWINKLGNMSPEEVMTADIESLY
jgi:RHS repeat-associated protein